MNNLERILDRINAEADLEVKKIEEAAALRVETIQKDTDERLDLAKRRAEAAAMKEYRSILERAEARGTMAEKEIILKAKSELIDKVYRDAESFILELPDDRYAEVMSSLLADAVISRMATVSEMTEVFADENYIGEAKIPFEVLLPEEHKKKFGRPIISGAEKLIASKELTVPKIKLSKEAAPIKGGFIVKYGEVQTNCSVSAMISSLKERTYASVASVLFR